MPTTKEEGELEYMRARMGSTTISDDPCPPPEATPPSSPPSEPEPPLDDSITAEEALSFKEAGNDHYKAARYEQAIASYTLSARSAHATDDARAVALANRAAAHLKLQRFRETADDASEALKLKPAYVKALKRRKEARVALKQFRGASEDAKEIGEGGAEVARLVRMADVKDKKDQEEAMESLKGLGNAFLSNFGMSLDDINMQQDPDTGGYSINMKN